MSENASSNNVKARKYGKNSETLDAQELLRVITAIKKGDFSVRMPVDQIGIAGKIYDALNDVIEMNDQMSKELEYVSRVVGKEGQITQRVSLNGMVGSWRTEVDSINSMITDLVQPTTEIGKVITAVANGDLTSKMQMEIEGRPLTGEFLRTAKTVNVMVDQLSTFASEVTRVAREVGTEGNLGGQAQVKGVGGTWKDLTDSVNMMAANLTSQVRNIAEVTTAVADGDLSKKITVDVRGEFLQLKETINTMVDQLNGFASEVTRVAREVGTEGRLGGQANVPGVRGTWKDLTDSVNMMAANLTAQVRNIADVTTAVADGDLSKKVTVDVRGEFLQLKKTINTMVDQLNAFATEVTRVAREVGKEGKLGGQAEVQGVGGTWKDLTDSVNMMAANLTAQVRNIAEVTTAVAKGDLSKKVTADVRGELLELKNTINTMVDQLNAFASEVTRVAREVGAEGRLGGQADVEGVGGTWKDLTDSVNMMAANLTAQVRNIAEVTIAVADGDLSKKITVDVRGEFLQLKETINTMVDQLNGFASEVTRVAREVGTEGKLGGQAQVRGVAGTWKDLTDNVNSMAANLTLQVRNIAEVTTAVANGDLSKKVTADVSGEFLQLKETINTMVDQLNAFASEVTRVAREVGMEGKLGGQADVEGVAGTWKDLTDNVNSMATNLTNQVRNIAEVTIAVANGDLSKKIAVDVRGEFLQLKETINSMVDQLRAFASEVTRVAREVGTEGSLGGQAYVPGAAGTWKDLTDNVNFMAANLTSQVRNIAGVTTAVANGDLTKKITVDAKGEILELKSTINTMVDQLNAFSAEVTRVAREVGKEGKLGGQAQVKGVAGTWKDLTDSVNMMADNLTAQVRNIAEVTTAVAKGDLSKNVTVDVRGEILELKNTINTMVDQLNAFASEVTRVSREVGTEGRLGGQAYVPDAAGTWKDLTDNVNSMAANLTNQVRNIAGVTTAVANGDLTKKITVDAKGEILELKSTINTMVDQLNAFAAEVTRVAREVGKEGKLGGQAEVKGVAGTWKDLTDSVNMMAANLTSQVRSIAKVVTAVAAGNLKQHLTVEAKGEVAELTNTINNMIDTLDTFSDQVISVAREVGIEGKLGGQANVPGTAGTWKDLVDNVNRLAANLTTQVRAIAEVATAVTKGDLSRSIAVEAAGEVASLKDNVNQMIHNLKDTTRINTEQAWLQTNLAKFTRQLQGQRDMLTVARLIMSELAPVVNVQHGVFYINEPVDDIPTFNLLSSYGYKQRKHISSRFSIGEGLIGQCAFEKQLIILTNVPADYIKVNSGLGEYMPLNIIVLPVISKGEVLAIIELASFTQFTEVQILFLEQLMESIGIMLNTIFATSRTEELLKQSQTMAAELQNRQEEMKETNNQLEEQANTLQVSEKRLKQQQDELQKANMELEGRTQLLAVQKTELERKNSEVEQARVALQEKAEQLALTSRYKSQFLANMSHELRTPLNSMLILSEMLADNTESIVMEKQIEYAKTIHSSGTELLELINDILDLSKIESGTVEVDIGEVLFIDLKEYVKHTFDPIADGKGIAFSVLQDPNLPKAIYSDERRLQQVLKNLLSNAFKFTQKGEVTLKIEEVTSGWSPGHMVLDHASSVIAFTVTDTGTGIPSEKHKIIFEAFQQVDSSTSRKYGGAGLGLAISREIANMLLGELSLISSIPDKGSTFTLFLPLHYSTRSAHRHGHESPQEFELSEIQSNGIQRKRTRKVTTDMQSQLGARVSSRPQLPLLLQTNISDDRSNIQPGDWRLLIVEDDAHFSNILLEVARKTGFKGIIALNAEDGLRIARQLKPDAIILDIYLPDMDGLTLLDILKHDLNTRHIPVHFITVDETQRQHAMRLGALSYMQKPVTEEELKAAFTRIYDFIERKTRNLLVVVDDEAERNSIIDQLKTDDVNITAMGTGEEALRALKSRSFDCILLNPWVPDTAGFELIEIIKNEPGLSEIPIIVYAQRDLTQQEETELGNIDKIINIRHIKSPDSLLYEAAILLRSSESTLPEYKRKMLQQVNQKEAMLTDKKILVVDDDTRNIFALTSLLELHKAVVYHATNGKDGIELLDEVSGIDLVIMDIMMPEMDGYEAIEAIRSNPKFKSLPIIALTAKAMRGDREKCLQAGASSYIPKPVESDRLLSTLRIWL